ncbi:MAG: linear amide C-N hydrolase [Planctomycetaceae bacterium]|nr:linear amide C-N hydrolase [Planctomycetaceae bacterium]
MCTDLRLLNPRNFRLSVRNLDFDEPMDHWVGFVPDGTTFRSIEPAQNQAQAVSWTTRYDYVSLVSIPAHLAGLPTPFLFDRLPPDLKAVGCDGINEKGLSAAALWDDDADFPDAAGQPADTRLLADFNVVEWLLGNFATVEEVRGALTGSPPIVIWGQVDFFGHSWRPLPFHYAVHDAAGNDFVIEITEKRLTFPEPVASVLANEPRLPWHRQNLSNYANLSFVDPPAERLSGLAIEPLGCGSGLLGLPGDFTPPSRFVRAVFLNLSSANCAGVDTPEKAVAHAFRFAGNVAPPYGLNHTVGCEDYTQWQVVRDHERLKFYVRTYFSIGTQLVDFAQIDFGKLEKPRYVRLADDLGGTAPIQP